MNKKKKQWKPRPKVSKNRGLNARLISDVINENMTYSDKPLPIENMASFGIFISLLKLKLSLKAESFIDVGYIRYMLKESKVELMITNNSASFFTHYSFSSDAELTEAKQMYDDYWQPRKKAYEAKQVIDPSFADKN